MGVHCISTMLCLFHVNYPRFCFTVTVITHQLHFFTNRSQVWRVWGNPGTRPLGAAAVGPGCGEGWCPPSRRGSAAALAPRRGHPCSGASAAAASCSSARMRSLEHRVCWVGSKSGRKKGSKLLVDPHLCSEDLTYSLAPTVPDTSLCTWNLLRGQILSILTSPYHPPKVTSVNDACVN